jgi:hypothetical protein
MTIDRDEAVKLVRKASETVLNELNNYVDRDVYAKLEVLVQQFQKDVMGLI